jgi:hypothetical protein
MAFPTDSIPDRTENLPGLDFFVEQAGFNHQPGAFLKVFNRDGGREAEIEEHLQIAGNDIDGAGPGMQVGNLERGWWKACIALVPDLVGHRGQDSADGVQGILG